MLSPQTIHLLSRYYRLGSTSYGDAMRDSKYDDTREWWYGSNWYEGKDSELSCGVHPHMGMHISMVWVVSYNLLNLVTTYCNLPPAILRTSGRRRLPPSSDSYSCTMHIPRRGVSREFRDQHIVPRVVYREWKSDDDNASSYPTTSMMGVVGNVDVGVSIGVAGDSARGGGGPSMHRRYCCGHGGSVSPGADANDGAREDNDEDDDEDGDEDEDEDGGGRAAADTKTKRRRRVPPPVTLCARVRRIPPLPPASVSRVWQASPSLAPTLPTRTECQRRTTVAFAPRPSPSSIATSRLNMKVMTIRVAG
jgi:hypothetical protein